MTEMAGQFLEVNDNNRHHGYCNTLNLNYAAHILLFTTMDDRMRTGRHFLQMMWYFTADRIIETAIQLYKLDTERANALRQVYLRPGDYTIRTRIQ